jgi:hypothetical protein
MSEMDRNTVMALGNRLDRLEREARSWMLLAVVALGLLGLAGLVGASPPVAEEVRARRFVLVDDAGREQARLGMGVVGALRPQLEPELCLGWG